MEKQFEKGKLKDLQVGEVLLVDAKKVKNGKIQLHFAEKIVTNDRPMSALTILNASDTAFSSGARRSWVIAEVTDAAERFNINFGDDGDWYIAKDKNEQDVELLDLNILNPHVIIKGKRYDFKVQINETTIATEWQADNLQKSAKTKGKNGDYITSNGNYIFSNTNVVVVPTGTIVKHTLLESDETSSQNITKGAEQELEDVLKVQ
tara:strand:- start:54 stop:671 length:618 start_codon:yes stop_codon:yes gene_type:complete